MISENERLEGRNTQNVELKKLQCTKATREMKKIYEVKRVEKSDSRNKERKWNFLK